MRVTVKLYGNLRRYGSREQVEYETPDVDTGRHSALTVRDLLQELGIPEQEWWMIAVNDTVVEPHHVLHDGDIIEIFEPVGGGG